MKFLVQFLFVTKLKSLKHFNIDTLKGIFLTFSKLPNGSLSLSN